MSTSHAKRQMSTNDAGHFPRNNGLSNNRVSDCCLTPILPKQHSELDFYSVSSLKQQSAGRHVAPLAHIILIPSQPVFALSPKCCVLSGEATNTNFIVYGLIRPGLEPTIYRTRGEHANHYATDVVKH